MMGNPATSEPRGTVSGTPLVDTTLGVNVGKYLVTKGWTPSSLGVLKAGDEIQIEYQLYKVLEDVDSDASGNATITIFPFLRKEYADDTSIITSSPKGIFRMLMTDFPLYDVAGDKTFAMSFTAVEALAGPAGDLGSGAD